MYVPQFNEERDIDTLHALVRSSPLGVWSALADGAIEVNSIPFLLREEGELGTLVGHVARGNDIWRRLGAAVESVVVFQGEQAYITPSWYPSKHKHGKAVPTWNYVVVQARGVARTIEDPQWLLQHVSELTDLHERNQGLPWKVSDAPPDFIDKMLGAIVGIEIPLTRLTGKWKLGQNRPEVDQLGMVAGLMSTEDPQAQGLASRLNAHVQAGSEE